jgi:hypothetical protein
MNDGGVSVLNRWSLEKRINFQSLLTPDIIESAEPGKGS